ncbi:MAG: 6-carboxytetrahydropterin synthase [Sulfolobales archaeon]|nr:6-carboxytetrahydropterin synthase [Sulfolobales archaeon]MDW8082694.1 6-carboxytetrahydropterin synthase [Sulfolobales archaeon]
MKYRVCVVEVFSAAHSIKTHTGVGQYLHGHDFRTRVCAVSEALDPDNIAVDLKHLESIVKEITDRLDHKYLNEELGIENLSMEYLAHYILREVRKNIPLVSSIEICSSEGKYCVEVSE